MVVAVLVKVVPDIDEVRYDPVTLTIQREASHLFLNPFDLRAVLTALDLRERGEKVVVVSMGPTQAARPLLDCLALGADRVILITDRSLAGSDTLVTARVLAAMIARLSPRIVLGGRYSVDGSTGQVLSQLASRLDLPFLEAARRISPMGEGQLNVLIDTEAGWEEHHVRLPVVIGVGEKIVRVRHPSEEDLGRFQESDVEQVSAMTLGFQPGQVGAKGSPTRVTAVRPALATRTPLILQNGPPERVVNEALQRIQQLLHAERPAQGSPAHRSTKSGSTHEIAILLSNMHGALDPRALPLIEEVLGLNGEFSPLGIFVGHLAEAEAERLRTSGVDRVICLVPPSLPLSSADAAQAVLTALGSRASIAAALYLSTAWSRAVAGRVSEQLGVGLAGDVLSVRWSEKDGLRFEKPAFGGGNIAEVSCQSRPAMATMRGGRASPHALRVAPVLRRSEGGPAPSTIQPSTFVDGHGMIDPLYGDLDSAKIVVGVGMGVGGPDNIRSIAQQVRSLGGALAASRKVVDAGWVPPQLQVGLTGRSIDPDIYIAVGIRGKPTHVAGVRRAKVIVAVNTQREDPIFQDCDVGIVGAWETILPRLLTELDTRMVQESTSKRPLKAKPTEI